MSKLSGAALARLAGVTKQAISQARKAGRLTPDEKGLYDPEAADVREYLAELSMRVPRATLGHPSGAKSSVARTDTALPADLGRDSAPGATKNETRAGLGQSAPTSRGSATACPGCNESESYASARARREVSKADREALELGQRRGELLSREDVERAFSIVGAGLNLYLRGLGDREGALLFAAAHNPDASERAFELLLDDTISKAISFFIADIERVRAGLPPLNSEMATRDAAELYAEARDYKKRGAPGHDPEPAKGDPV